MSKVDYKFVINAAGRKVPTIVNGRKAPPYVGVGKYEPTTRKAAPPIISASKYPEDGNKVVPSLKEALQRCGLSDGMCISTHHHFRDGDIISNEIFRVASELGVKDLMWFPSAAFPCNKPMIEMMDKGVLHHIEGSLNGPLGEYASRGKMRGLAVLRSHGGRYRAIQDGDVHIDIAVVAAPEADPFGNANGVNGPSACGLISYAKPDSMYGDRTIVVTDNLVPFPCIPWQIQGQNVDYVVKVDKVGIPEKIVSGTTVVTNSPDRLLIAELAARFVEEAGILKDGFSFQCGAGGTSLAFTIFLDRMMRDKGIKARFISAGSTKYAVKMLEEGLTDYILDGQTFDLDAVKSIRENLKHIPTGPFEMYNYHGKGFCATMLDAVVLGATEIDVNYNGNVVTHSDGRLLHGIGGWQNCLFANCVILPIPLFRERVPIIVDKVTTLCGPGELIDVIVTERGIAINPVRKDLIEATERSDLPFKTIKELKEEAEAVTGGPPAKPDIDPETPIGVVEWVDGTVLDTIWKVLK